MLHGRRASLVTAFALLLATSSLAAEAPWIAGEETRSRITLVDVDGSSPQVVLDSPHRYAAPEWTPDGASLIVNGGGKLWRVPVSGGSPTPIPTGSATWIDVNHAISPDGKSLAFTAGSIWTLPAEGGEPERVTAASKNYVHSWSPDGGTLAFSSDHGRGLDLFSISPDGGSERKLTTSPRADDLTALFASPSTTPRGQMAASGSYSASTMA